MAVSFILARGQGTFPFFLLFSVVPIIIAGYVYGLMWAYIFSAVLSAFCIGLAKFGLARLPILLSVVNFNLIPLIVFRFHKIFKYYKETCKKNINDAEEFYQKLVSEDKDVREFNARLEKDVLEMARIYEITKAMSTTLEFSGIFAILKSILQKTFKFASAKMILLSKDTATDLMFIQTVYNAQRPKKLLLF